MDYRYGGFKFWSPAQTKADASDGRHTVWRADVGIERTEDDREVVQGLPARIAEGMVASVPGTWGKAKRGAAIAGMLASVPGTWGKAKRVAARNNIMQKAPYAYPIS